MLLDPMSNPLVLLLTLLSITVGVLVFYCLRFKTSLSLKQMVTQVIRKRVNTTIPTHFNNLYVKLQELPSPVEENQQKIYRQFKATLDELVETAQQTELTPDLLRLMLETIAAQSAIEPILLRLEMVPLQGNFEVELQMRHWSVPLLVENLARYLSEQGGPNFAQVKIFAQGGNPRNPSLPAFTVTIEHCNGKSPGELLAQEKAETARLRQTIAEIEQQLTQET
ncbi:hypothetical protein ACQ4M3_07890 [Leptolyngbya sp. AN03gr2]|uniref:hypothetical protein n=1 Tax=unclassified Leptolyngbya TaxID=2650499 RepID=UPI003D31A258